MSLPTFGGFLLTVVDFSALGAVFGIIYRTLESSAILIRSISTVLWSCAKETRVLHPSELIIKSKEKKGFAGKILAESVNFVLILLFGVLFLGVWYLLTDATVRLMYPVMCLTFFVISSRLFGGVLRKVGIFLGFAVSLFLSFPVLSISKIAKRVKSIRKKVESR